MTVSPHMQQRYRVRFDEAGASGHLRSSGYLRYAQDLAWVHSEQAGFGRRWYRERGLVWLIRAVQLDILDDVAYGAELDVSTEVAGFRRVWGRRHSEFRVASPGRVVGEAVIDWVLLNSGGTPARVPAEITDLFAGQAETFSPLRLAPAEPPGDATVVAFEPRQSEVDPLGHVNNAAYLDYLEQHLALTGRRGEARQRPRRYRLEFVASAQAGMTLTGRGWDQHAAWQYQLEGEDGKVLMRATMETDPALWVGG